MGVERADRVPLRTDPRGAPDRDPDPDRDRDV